jgi:opacity protein-like surface antigen
MDVSRPAAVPPVRRIPLSLAGVAGATRAARKTPFRPSQGSEIGSTPRILGSLIALRKRALSSPVPPSGGASGTGQLATGVGMDRIGIRKSALLGSSALIFVLSGSSGALAQNCTTFNTQIGNLSPFVAFSVSSASSIASSVANMNTAFLGQQGSAFVANPGGAAPGQQGGGVWVRGVGGEVTIESTSVASANFTVAPPANIFNTSGTVTCSSKERDTFGGVQVGADIARLNMGGWNINLGSTAGYLESDNKDRTATGTKTNLQVPFLGTYLVATYGGFFADVMVRGELYNIELNNPGLAFFNQPFGAHGVSVSTSVGYNMPLGNNWFIEPSAGFVWSRTKVDAFNAFGPTVGGALLPAGTVTTNDIDGKIGRATVRVGTSFTSGNVFLQPFVSASVFHEFAGDVTSRFQTCPGCAALDVTFADGSVARFAAAFSAQSSTSRVGTYGQFSAGIAGQVLNTGWVGFVRGDYRTGDNIEGWTANAGLRYNFVPGEVAAPLITKGPPVPPPVTVVNWTGFYVGGFLGANTGTSSINITGVTRPRIGGIIGGGEAGYNWQLGNYVVGIEADGGPTNTHGSRACGINTGLGFTSFFFTCKDDFDWIATVAGRLGVAWDRALIYVKAGGAFTTENFTASCIGGPLNAAVPSCFNPAGALSNGFTASNDKFGFVGGFGSEFALSPYWSAKTEFTYIDFGKDSVRASDGTFVRLNTWVAEAKVGVNYHFSPMSPY